ncbi:sulfotransferase, partial [Akkermansiaceae bacterium]|nr:sulfotransferase [Akkermansiaceae bacterium]
GDKAANYFYDIMRLGTSESAQIYCTHNGFEPFELSRYFRVLKNSRMIMVSRDPRDIYVNIVEGNKVKSGFYRKIDPNHYNICAASDIQKFIQYQKKLLSFEVAFEHPKLLRIQFEEFIGNYDHVADIIRDFLGISSSNQVDKFKYFNPSESEKNVGIYKKSKFQKEIQMIESELQDFYDFD